MRLRLWPVTVDGARVSVLVADRMARPGVGRDSGMAQAARNEVHEQADRCPLVAGALTFDGAVDLDGPDEPDSADVDAVMDAMARGGGLLSPEYAAAVADVLITARAHVEQGGSGLSPTSGMTLAETLRVLDRRFPHETFGRTVRPTDGSDHG